MINFIADMNASIERHERELASKPRKGMMVYLDKSTPILVQFANDESFNNAKAISSRKGQQSCLRNVIDNGGKLI
jgi:hypothetical protein